MTSRESVESSHAEHDPSKTFANGNGRPDEQPGSPQKPDEVDPGDGDSVNPGQTPTEVPPDQLPGSD
ncbi:hypothetical protein CP97_12540 [Aurantiacibacter atlanticus]|uniref:Uncharacterized protein n=1 Tax=Aurantiacibacter atlanticus TaxID=1648404 RepID=A0A0H4VZT9_9SPHN|nr:hypothetical protein CP97_12540 [Aurantiacibacter atlanticus]